MNVYKFLNFIGEKRPQYNLNADNPTYVNEFKRNYKQKVKDDEKDDDEETLYLQLNGKSKVDEKGRQGIFLKIVASHNSYIADDDVTTEHDFKFDHIFTNFKDDKKDGPETQYFRGTEDPHMESIYDDGRLVKTTNYMRANGDTKKVQAIMYYNEDGRQYKKEQFYVNQNAPNTMSTLYELKPDSERHGNSILINGEAYKWHTKHFSPDGEEVDTNQFTRIKNELQGFAKR